MNTEIFSTEESKYHHHIHALAGLAGRWFDESLPTFDFGCGDGFYLKELAGYPAGPRVYHPKLTGIEGTRNIVNPLWPYIIQWDLRNPLWIGTKGNVMSVEVAEHIAPEFHETYMDNLSRHCEDKLLLTWAVRGQGGTRHVSERNEDEVVPFVQQWGFDFLKEQSYRWREIVGKECGYMKNTIYLFQRPFNLEGCVSV